MPKFRTLITVDQDGELNPPGSIIELTDKAAAPLLEERAIEPAPEAEPKAAKTSANK